MKEKERSKFGITLHDEGEPTNKANATSMENSRGLHDEACSVLSIGPDSPITLLISGGRDGTTHVFEVRDSLPSYAVTLRSGKHYATSIAWLDHSTFFLAWSHGLITEFSYDHNQVRRRREACLKLISFTFIEEP